jgi:hypothetical protein
MPIRELGNETAVETGPGTEATGSRKTLEILLEILIEYSFNKTLQRRRR